MAAGDRLSIDGHNYTGEEIMAAGEQRWRELADRIATEAGFDLEDLAVVAAGRRRLVRVIIDADDGVSLDAAADLSRRLSEAFDAAEQDGEPLGAAPYTLEVTSPGIGRPLTEPRHFRRAVGRLITVTTTENETVTARVLGLTESGVDLLTGRDGTQLRQLRFTEIAKAKVEVDFSGPSEAVAALLAADPRSAAFAARQRPATPDSTDEDEDER
jgi:ribosome maturation factor RimP